MSSTSVFKSFDPLAVHPFTNNSGLLPQPTPPSQYPQSIPSPALSSTSTTPSSSPTPGLVHAPQPKIASPAPAKKSAGSAARAPVFVPFRPERSSPELDEILLKSSKGRREDKSFSIVHRGKEIGLKVNSERLRDSWVEEIEKAREAVWERSGKGSQKGN